MTIFNEGRHAIRALCTALAATAGRAENCFVQGLTRSEGVPLTIIAGSPDRRIAGSPDRRIAGSPDRRIAGSPDRRIALPASSWWRRLKQSASRPESSASTGGPSDTRRPASSSDSFDLSPARAAAGSRPVARRLRRGLAAGLLCLPLLTVFATGAQAQECTGAGPHEVPHDWALKPSGLSAGDNFRLLFVTSTARNASSTDIATYNTFVQTRAKAGHSAITDSCGNQFKVVGSTSAVDARDNTSTTGAGQAIYWLNGVKVADNYSDFYDGNWDSYQGKNESGGSKGSIFVWTGSNNNGTKNSQPLGGDGQVRRGLLNVGSGSPLSISSHVSRINYSFYALSPIFTVAAPDTTAPSVTSITRQTPSSSPTNADSLTWRITFNEAVRNVDTADFQVSGTTATITAVSPVTGSETTTYDVTATGGDLAGLNATVTLSFASGHNIEDMAGNSLATSPTVSGTNDNSYVVDNTAPGVTSITRQTPATSSTGADSLTWRVTFDEAVQHVNTADFQVSGTTATITAVSPVTGSETTTYAVTATGGDLAGLNATVTLSFASSHNIEDEAGNSLATSPTVSGTNDNTFVVQNTATSVTVSISAPANANEDNSGTTDKHFTVTLSSALTQSFVFSVCYSGTATRGASDDYQALATSSVDVLSGRGCRDFTMPAGDTTLSGVVGMRINGDTDAEPDETVIATLSFTSAFPPPASVTLGTSTATYTILNDDGTLTEPMVTIKGGHEVREGRGAAFTLTANPARAAPTEVNINVSQTGDFLAGSPGTRTVTIPSGQTSHTFTVATVNDGGRDAFGQTQGQESDGSVTATVDAGTGYTLGSPSSATVNILDDDTNAAKGNHIRVSGRGPATLNEDSRGTRHFRVSRYGDPANTTGAWGFKLCFAGTATPGADYTLDNHFAEERGIAIGADGCTARRTIPGSSDLYHFYISHVDDPHAEGTETIVVTVTGLNNVFFSDQPGINIIRFTIVDDDTPAPPKPQQGEQDAQPAQIETPSCVSDALLADAQAATTETWRTSPGHVERWSRVLAAFGVDNAYSSNPMTVAEAQAQADRGLQRWKPVAPALECLENPPQEEQPEQAEVQPVTPATPELSLSAGSAVDEGGNATFTVTADPAPQSDLTIAWTVAQSGEYLAAPGAGSRTVTLKAGTTSVALSVATVDDAADEADGSVSVTLDTGTGYTIATGKGSAAVTVRDNDATPATPELSLWAGSAVDEGGNATFTVTADPAPATDLTVTWTVAQSGDYLDAPGAGSRTVTLAAGATSTDLSVATVDDAADEADGSVSVTLGTGTGYTIATGKGSAAVAVRDNDEPAVSIAAGSSVTEGSSASFTVTASPVPAAPLDVTLTVGQSGDFAASGETGSRTVTVPVTGNMTFEVATVDDGADEPDGSITATLGTGTGYTVAASPDNAATVAVSDNDAASSGPTISIADATFNENADRVHFTVTLSEPVDRTVTVRFATRDSSPVSAVADQDYLAWQRAWQVWARFRPGETETRIFTYIYNDSHDEDPETFEMVLFDASDGVSIADGVAVGTIVNDDPMPAAWLARFGRTAAEQALDGIAGRIAASRGAGVQGTIAGQALNLDPGSQSGAANDHAAPGSLAGNDLLAQSDVARAFGAGHGGFGSSGPDGFGHDSHGFGFDSRGTGAQSRSMTGREALLGSSFTATGEKDGTGGSLAFWGRAAQSSFDGREGTFSLDGEATTAMLGADYARGNWLVGMALMQSSGEGGYADRESGPQHCPDVGEGMSADVIAHLCGGAVREGDGKVEASLTAAVPYAAIQASERLRLWGAAGYGTGEVTLKPEVGGRLSSDISWTMAAAGLRGDVIAPPAEGSGPALAVTSDALWARTSSDKTHELAASDSDVTRLRLGLEGSYRIATEGGGHVTPKLEAGMRHDGGDAETGFGVELGGGLAWVDPALGLSLDVSGRTLVAHGNDDLKDRGFAASLAFDPDPASERGLSLALRQEMGGQAKGGLDALFRADPLADRTGSGETAARWTAEAAYGFPAFSGRFTGSPHVGVGLATAARGYSVGWRLTPAANANAPDLSFGVRATRRESDGTVPEHTTGFEVIARW